MRRTSLVLHISVRAPVAAHRRQEPTGRRPRQVALETVSALEVQGFGVRASVMEGQSSRHAPTAETVFIDIPISEIVELVQYCLRCLQNAVPVFLVHSVPASVDHTDTRVTRELVPVPDHEVPI